MIPETSSGLNDDFSGFIQSWIFTLVTRKERSLPGGEERVRYDHVTPSNKMLAL